MGGIYLLLGTNMGDRKANLEEARKRIGNVIRSSSVYSTAAWGMEGQPDFFNQVVEIESDLRPEELLNTTLKIESEMGRVREKKWGPRLIDIDILLYRNVILNSPNLKIPHPEIQNRRFTLIPLREIFNGTHPVLKKTIAELLAECKDNLPVTRLPLQQ